jgi:glutamate synthase domain-containing protein 2
MKQIKPGGGQLPGEKVVPWIAETRIQHHM